MKKFPLLLIALLTFLLALCGCKITDDNDGVTRGETTEIAYINESIDVTFVKPTDWRFYSYDEIAEADDMARELFDDKLLAQSSKITSFTDFMAIQSSTGNNVSLALENLRITRSTKLSMEEISEKVKEAAKNKIKDMTFEFGEDTPSALDGKPYLRLNATTTYDGIRMKQYMYLKKVGYHLVSITVTVGNDESVETFEKMFAPELRFTLSEDEQSYEVSGMGNYIEKEVVVPATHKGLPVTAIRAHAFSWGRGEEITGVVLPDTVVSVGEMAFYGCKELESVTLSDSVARIEESAFYNCYKLKNIRIGNGVTYVGETAFGNCEEIVYNEQEDGCYLGNEVNPYLLLMDTKHEEIRSFTIPEQTRILYDGAFFNCASLQEITLPDGILDMGYGVFMGCSSLKSVVLLDSIKTVKENAFYGCTSLESVTFGNSLEQIEAAAFQGCTSLQNITFPSTLKSIGLYAFYLCDKIERVTLPASLTYIETNAFLCKNLQEVTFVDPNDWTLRGVTMLSADELADPTIAAQYLKETHGSSSWVKEEA